VGNHPETDLPIMNGANGMNEITAEESVRYDRQMLIEGWGEEGQMRLKKARVFVAGAGGLGGPVSIYLAVAGVGELVICDADHVELSNLNRQILHPTERIGEFKAHSAAQTLGALNPEIQVSTSTDFLDEQSVERLVGHPDVVVDCLDNFETRYLLNRYCLTRGIPFVHGAVRGLLGQTTFIASPETPCLRCIFPEAPPKEKFPVVGATPGIVGTIQAMEVLKHLTGVGETLRGTLLMFEGDEMEFTRIVVKRREDCPDCGR
jgi:adenylyltransferase/sulfurtransferase